MVDTLTYVRMHGGSSNRHRKSTSQNLNTDPWPLVLSVNDELDDDHLLLLPKQIAGFDFLEKRWG